MISESELSDEFSLDTVGSHGDVKCKGRFKDYLVRFEILSLYIKNVKKICKGRGWRRKSGIVRDWL